MVNAGMKRAGDGNTLQRIQAGEVVQEEAVCQNAAAALRKMNKVMNIAVDC
jgi:hypothetical protein